MPIINILLTREGSAPERTCVSAEEKARLIKGVSDLLLDVLGKPLESTFVTIQEIDLENWGWGGLPVPQYRELHAWMPLLGRRPEPAAAPLLSRRRGCKLA
jgi:4-oxalocrotonate tautomerase